MTITSERDASLGWNFAAAIFVTVHSTVIFSGWTGDPKLAKSLSVVVGLLLFGTALNSAMQFPYALQLSSGRSHLPMIINIALLVVFVPLLILLSLRFGVVGAAAAWAILNTLYLFLGIWVTHRTLLPGVGLRWLSADVGAPLLAGLVIVGGGGATLRSTVLPAPVTAAVGLIFAGVAFVAVVSLTPGMAEFARRMFAFRRPLFEARA